MYDQATLTTVFCTQLPSRSPVLISDQTTDLAYNTALYKHLGTFKWLWQDYPELSSYHASFHIAVSSITDSCHIRTVSLYFSLHTIQLLTFLSSGVSWFISIVIFSVFQIQELLVKYSSNIMALWRRDIVFIILQSKEQNVQVTVVNKKKVL